MSENISEAETKFKDKMSAARLQRVEGVLQSEPAFEAKLGKKSVKVPKRSGKDAHFCQEVVDVTQAIADDGKDSVGMPKTEIIAYATRVLLGGAQAAAPEAPKASKVKATSVDHGAEAPAVDSSKGPKISNVIPCLSLVVGAKQFADALLHDSPESKPIQKLVKYLADAQEISNSLANGISSE